MKNHQAYASTNVRKNLDATPIWAGLFNILRISGCLLRIKQPCRPAHSAYRPSGETACPLVVRYNHTCGILPLRMLDLRSKARQRLLLYYFTNPTARHHLRDLAERLSVDPSNLSKELGRLEREGLFRSEVSGRQKYFQLNRKYSLFNEVRRIVAKTIGAGPLLAQSLEKIEGIEEAYLYGSFARNQQDAVSDIDVLVIGRPGDEALAEAVLKLERQLGREINYTVLSRRELEARRARKDTLLAVC